MNRADINDRSGVLTFPLFYREPIIIALSVISALLAAYLMPLSRDFSNYQILFEDASGADRLIDLFSSIELVFPVLFYVTSSLLLSAFIAGCLGIYVKLRYFDELGEAGWIATSFYFAYFFVLQDVTQIRASFASALLLAGYMFLRKSRNALAITAFLAAVTTHISVLIYIPIICLAAIVRNPVSILRYAFIVLIGVFVFKLFIPFNLSEWGLESLLPDYSRLLAYLRNPEIPDLPSFAAEKYLYMKFFAIGVIAFTTQITDSVGNVGPQRDWPARAGLILTFACILLITFYETFEIAGRLSELAAPFECAVIAAFIVFISKLTYDLVGAGGTVLLQIVFTTILILLIIGSRIILLN